MAKDFEPNNPLRSTMTQGNRDFAGDRPRSSLSSRQQECLRGVLQLKSAKEIARDLGISPHVVEKHLKVCREKFGVMTTAEAARIFSLLDLGPENSPGGSSDLAKGRSLVDDREVSGRLQRYSSGRLEDPNGALSLDHPLTLRQTLSAIVAVSFLSIIGLLLLVACAEGIRSLVSR